MVKKTIRINEIGKFYYCSQNDLAKITFSMHFTRCSTVYTNGTIINTLTTPNQQG